MKRVLICCLFSLLCLFLVSGSASAVTLTAQQKQMLEQLSPAEKAALAEKYGVSLPAAATSTAREELPPVVNPRQLEKSAIEQETRTGNVDDLDEREALGNSVSADVPVAKVRGQGAAEGLEVRQGFADFVSESKALSVNTDLQQFGYQLFAGTPTTFAPATDVPVPAEYVLGPGDELKVQLFGKTDEQLVMVVDREGVIAFPEIGPLNVTGMSFAEARAFIAEQIKEKTIGVSASITMGELRSIRIFALGEVERPGSYLVSGLATLSHALFVSGGVKKIGSLRNVQLKRAGRQVASIDLYDFLLKGDTSDDVRLLPGDVVFVPPIGPTVGVAGEVTRPAIYELRGERTLTEVLRLAGGLRPTAYREKALVERVAKRGERAVLEVSLLGDGVQTVLQSHDLVKVFSVLDYEANPVFLIGNVKRPGKYSWQRGMRLSALLPSATELLPETYYDYGLIEREAADNREPEMVRFSLAELFSGSGRADLLLQPRDKVYIFHRSHFRQQPMVRIEGTVQSPGQYELKRSMRVIDLILAAGGLQRDALVGPAQLYRTDALTKDLHILDIDIERVLANDEAHNLLLDDLDRLVVHSIWETRDRSLVSVVGEVEKPGDYQLAEGMRISDLVFAAGNVTDRAYLKLAEVTRYQVVDGEKRIAQHKQVDLTAALRGAPEANLMLQPYDVLNVRTVSNWRTAEKITLSGELKYPGVYPVEDGERLSSVLERAGGFLDDAYLPAAVFTRVSILKEQQEQIEAMSRRVEEQITILEGQLGNITDAQILRRKQQGLDGAKDVLKQMREVKSTGRLVIRLADIEELKGTEFDLTLRDGDRLHVPKRPDEIHVIGQVYNPIAQLYHEGEDRDDYIERAGGLTRFADKKKIYVVRADGSIDAQRGWRKKIIQAGDVIVVPEQIERFSLLESTLDWSRVFMQLGVGVAAMKTLDIL